MPHAPLVIDIGYDGGNELAPILEMLIRSRAGNAADHRHPSYGEIRQAYAIDLLNTGFDQKLSHILYPLCHDDPPIALYHIL